MSQNYGVLRVVRVRPPANRENSEDRYPAGRLPEEGLVHVITHRETTIGRALNNHIILRDPTVSREHARLVLDQHGWHIINLTMHNVVRVNGQPVPSGSSLPMQPQDVLVLGSTMLQLIAPHSQRPAVAGARSKVDDVTDILPSTHPVQPMGVSAMQGVSRKVTPLPVQPEPEQAPHRWEEDEHESVLGGVTMQFALPQRMGVRTRWLIAGAGIAILAISASITIVLNSLIGLSALERNGLASIIAALIIPLVPAIGINLLVNFMDRFEREPWFLRLAAFLWGAIIAIPPALFIEQRLDTVVQNLLGPSTNDIVRTALQGLNAGFTEETIKGLGLLLLFFILRDEFDNVTDGIVYGALIGAGFAMVENFAVFARDSKQFLVFLIVGRVILGWLGHSTFTACFGAALGYIRHTNVRWKQIVVPLVGYLVAVGLHSFFDFVDFQASAAVRAAPGNSSVAFFSLVAVIGDYVPPFLAQLGLLYILTRSLVHEGAVIREFLAVEVTNGIVMVDEYALLQNSFRRTKEERRILWDSGIKQWMHVKALYQTEIGLAFRKWHVSMGDKPKLGYLQPEDAYRKRIRRLRNEIRGADLKAGASSGLLKS
jgi:RsiW-degrading membrane proteinase PrsW (M82 family)